MVTSPTSQKMVSFVHEIKNELAVIKAYTQLLQKRLVNASDKKSLSYLAKIDAQINKLIDIFRKGKKYE